MNTQTHVSLFTIIILIFHILSAKNTIAPDYHRINFLQRSPEATMGQKNHGFAITVTEKPSSFIWPSSTISKNSRDAAISRVIDLAHFQNISQAKLEYTCNQITSVELFNHFHLYCNQNYLNYIRQRPEYQDFIVALHEKIHKNHAFRKSLRNMPGFQGKTGFQDFINQEATRIKTTRYKQAQIKKYAVLSKKMASDQARAHATNNPVLISRYQKRIDLVNQACNKEDTLSNYAHTLKKYPVCPDPGAPAFNNCYGTALDKQLHVELCETRTTVLELQTMYPNNFHVKTVSPLIYHVTAQAKQEKDLTVAFDLADAADNLTNIMLYGVELLTKVTTATARGLTNATKTVLSLQHWHDMGAGILKLGTFLVDELVKYDDLTQAYASCNHDRFQQASIDYYQHNQAQINAIHEQTKITLNRLKTMSWEELVEHGVELGATLILDTVALNAAGWVASNTGRAVVSELAEIMQTSKPFAQEYLTEIAGIGKFAIEEGSEITNTIITVKNHPTKIKQTGGRLTAYEQMLHEEKIAAEIYETIRKSTDDIEKIAQNTGMPQYKINRVKQHVFHDNTHILSNGRGTARFDPDLKIGEAWKRLENGTFTVNDIKLIEHEYFESKFEKIFKVTAEKAHESTKNTKTNRFLDRDWIPE